MGVENGERLAGWGPPQWGLYIRLARRHRVCDCHGMVRWKAHSQGYTAALAWQSHTRCGREKLA